MSDHESRIKDTQTLYRMLRKYFDRFIVRKTALQDEGTLSDLTPRDHTVNEWLYDLEQRLQKVEGFLEASTGEEHEQPVEIPLHVNHLKQ